MTRITDIQRLLSSGEISCRELTEQYLSAISRDNGRLNAYITVTDAAALSAADAVDIKLKNGEALHPLEGVPFVLKDNIVTDGVRTTCASKMLENHVPVYDAFVWSQLKSCGAVMLGKGNMDEFAMGSTNETSYFGAAKNPHNVGYVAGGSSGGVAAAVAGGLAVYGVGSDTGGSVRQPASFCGAVGLKPTYGAVSRRGLIAFASSFDQIGPIAACVEDAAAVYDAMCGIDSLDMTSRGGKPAAGALMGDVHGKKIGIAREFYEKLQPEVQDALSAAMREYEKMGAELVSLDFPQLKYALPTYYILACAEASSNLGKFDGIRFGHGTEKYSDIEDYVRRSRSEGFGAEVRRRILLGTYVLSAGYYDAYYGKAQALRQSIGAQFDDAFAKCDMLLTPTVPTTALKSGAQLDPVSMYQTDICTVTANIAGVPAISVPCGFDAGGLPIGMQLIGRKFAEAEILSAALAFERGTDSAFLKSADMGVKL